MVREGLGAGWQCLFANDNDREKAASYAANFGRQGLIVGDVARLTTANLSGVASLAWVSFPCQDLSLAGDRAGLGGSRSGTFWAFWRLMQALRAEGRAPRVIVVENVLGLLSSHDGADFAVLVDALVEGGYRAGALVIDAALFVPQSRERVFVVAVDAALIIPDEIVAPRPETPFHSPMLVKAQKRLSPKAQAAWLWFRLEAPAKRNLALVDIVEDTPTGVSWHTQTETDRLRALMSPINLAKVDAARSSGARAAGAVFRRMRPGEDGADVSGQRVQRAEIRFDIAGCLRVPSGGSSRQTIMMVEGDTVRSRLMSPRECARLMGLPDSYKLPADLNEALGLMGDGVVVPVVRHLAEHILEPLMS
jgi:DNA (cytosine-5)-methyltransferase 1